LFFYQITELDDRLLDARRLRLCASHANAIAIAVGCRKQRTGIKRNLVAQRLAENLLGVAALRTRELAGTPLRDYHRDKTRVWIARPSGCRQGIEGIPIAFMLLNCASMERGDGLGVRCPRRKSARVVSVQQQ
jgi:hypothetical protein